MHPDKLKTNFHIDNEDVQVTHTLGITFSPLSSELLPVWPDHRVAGGRLATLLSRSPRGLLDPETERYVVYLSTQDVLRWQLASSHIAHHKRPDIAHASHQSTYMCERMVNLSISVDYSDDAFIPLRVWFGTRAAFVLWLILLTSSYAAIHYTALSVHFPTYLEHQSWQASSFVFFVSSAIALSYITLEAMAAFVSHNRRAREIREAREMREIGRPWFCLTPLLLKLSSMDTHLSTHRRRINPQVLIIQLFAWPFALAYIAARLYIVVEAFVSLRRVPLVVYTTVDWATYLPHF